MLSTTAWGRVLVHWTSSSLPPAHELGLSDLVIPWNGDVSQLAKTARAQGYRVFIQVPWPQATAAAETAAHADAAGLILNVGQSERNQLAESLPQLRSAYPKLRFSVLDADGKQPQMRGSLVIKRGSVLQVSSPTAQPWLDTNLALVRVEQRSDPEQSPLYTFSWATPDSGQQQQTPTTTDYALAVAEAGAFHADLILELDQQLQKALGEHEPKAWKLWSEVLSTANFYSQYSPGLEAAANVAVVVDDLDATDETLNLLARHNIPFKVLLPTDLKTEEPQSFDVIVVFAKPDEGTRQRIADLAAHGKTVVMVDAHGSYPWHNGQPARLNEHAVSYAIGTGKVLELAEPVTDPETFARDIRRLLGKQNMLMNLWNGLTTLAVPYREHGRTLKLLELVNYSADPLRLQVQVKGIFASIRYETPEHQCCQSLVPVKKDGFTEFVLPELRIAGRVYLEQDASREPAKSH